MKYLIKDLPFAYVCKIVPKLDKNKMPKEYKPQSKYKNPKNLSLHKYGRGSFCSFKIPTDYLWKAGVYIILVNEKPKYVGECDNLERRFNEGYGRISPRNCYEGGQQTNCRINNLILEEYKKGSKIELIFYETRDRFNIENFLVRELQPEWNKSMGKLSLQTGAQSIDELNKVSQRRENAMGKYHRLEQYLKDNQRETEILRFDNIEEILGFKLPKSAYVYRAWWANDKTHSQAKSWLNAGWRVVSVDFVKKSVKFEKVLHPL
jgi:hypothetical protein